jgi:hypothetical protein
MIISGRGRKAGRGARRDGGSGDLSAKCTLSFYDVRIRDFLIFSGLVL